MAIAPRPACPMCRSPGRLRYQGLSDRLYGVPGRWDLRSCLSATCDVMWLDPAPTEADIGKAYRTYYTHPSPEGQSKGPVRHLLSRARRAYLSTRFGYHHIARGQTNACFARALFALVPGGRDFVDATACHLPAPQGEGRLLEIGFGNPEQLCRMRDLGWQVEGVDPDPRAVAAAQSRGLVVHCGDLASQHFASQTFDAIYMSHVIEHVHDPPALLVECQRILRVGGRLVVVTPNVRSWGHHVFGPRWLHLDPPRHLTLFSTTALSGAVETAGLEIDDVRTSARIAVLTWAYARDVRRRETTPARRASTPALLAALLRAVPSQFAESWLLRLRPDAGEEIVLVARKPSPSASSEI